MSDEAKDLSKLIELHDEADIRRYEARWSFYKVVFGTTIVGLVAAVLPYWIQVIQERSKRTNDYRSFVAQYIDNGIAQDIELRIRFAEYFSYLADEASKDNWKQYHSILLERRSTIRSKIGILEKSRAKLISEGDDALSESDQIELAEIERSLSWAYGEVGYAQRNTSIIQQPNPSRARAFDFTDLDPAYLRNFSDFLSNNGIEYVAPEELLVFGAAHFAQGGQCYGLNRPPPEELWPNIIGVAKALDALRERTDAVVRITSAFRAPEYNKCIGGPSSSVQTRFLGVDVASENWTPSQLAEYFDSLRQEGIFEGGIGVYNSFVHIDARGHRADWQQ